MSSLLGSCDKFMEYLNFDFRSTFHREHIERTDHMTALYKIEANAFHALSELSKGGQIYIKHKNELLPEKTVVVKFWFDPDGFRKEFVFLKQNTPNCFAKLLAAFSIDENGRGLKFDADKPTGRVLCLVFANCGDNLSNLCRLKKSWSFNAQEVQHVFNSIGKALRFLHRSTITHNQVCPRHIVSTLHTGEDNQLVGQLHRQHLCLVDFSKIRVESGIDQKVAEVYSGLRFGRPVPKKLDDVYAKEKATTPNAFLQESGTFGHMLMRLAIYRSFGGRSIRQTFSQPNVLGNAPELKKMIFWLAKSNWKDRITVEDALHHMKIA